MAVKSHCEMVFVPPLLNALAPWNMPSMDVTLVITHLLLPVGMGWLKASAPLNMFFMFVTAVVSQVLMSWLNFMAPWNMPSMSVTASISHFLLLPVGMGWLKASAPLNMFVVFVMAVKSQFWMVFVPPLLNALAPWNMPSMDVTAIVTHLEVPGVSSWLNA